MPISNDATGTPRFAKQPIGHNKLAKLIPDTCKAGGIEGLKTGHSGRVTCAATLNRKGLSGQLVRERTGHRSLETLHKYKRTGSEQQQELSLALAPTTTKEMPLAVEKENTQPKYDEDDDFVPLKKKPKIQGSR